jgi:hypothetical protein
MTARLTHTPVDDRIRRLSDVSAKRLIDPDEQVPGAVGPGQILPDELLSVDGLDLDLTAEQKTILSREEVASMTNMGIRFEAVLEAGFALQIATRLKPTDPRTMFLLHEIGEETRHQRLFIRLLEQLAPTAVNPLDRPAVHLVQRVAIRSIIAFPALLYTLVLGGEEIPDLLQKRASEHPETDPFLRDVNRYHRQEEARHLSYARAVLAEVWAEAGPADRFAVRHIAPRIIGSMFNLLVHPGVYEAAGLPGWETWKQVRNSPKRVAFRQEATRPVLDALLAAGVFQPGRVPSVWCRLTGYRG